MSGLTLRHYVKRKVHLNRQQTDKRKKYGLLEKHKDYVLRAQNYHQKRKQIQNLREKGRLKNPDEFYFNMINSHINEEGKYEANKTQKDSILSNYNKNVLQMKATALEKSKAKINESFHLFSSQPQNTHILFESSDYEVNSDIEVNATKAEKEFVNNFLHGIMKLEKNISKKKAFEYASTITKKLKEQHDSFQDKKQTAALMKKALEEFELRENLSKSKHYQYKKIVDPVSEKEIYQWKSIRKR